MTAPGFKESVVSNVTVTDSKAIILDFHLIKNEKKAVPEITPRSTPTSSTLTERLSRKPISTSGNSFIFPFNTEQIKAIISSSIQPKQFNHHNYKQLTQFLKNINTGFPSISRLYSIGQSIEGREIWVLEISNQPGVHQDGKPEFKFIANMHGNEVVGRECLLLLIQLLCMNYKSSIHIKRIIDSSRIHFLPTMNPDGYERAVEGDRDGVKGRNNALDSDLNRNFPDQFDPPGTLNKIQP